LFTQRHTLLFTQRHTLLFTQRHTLLFTQTHTLLFTQRHTLLFTQTHTLLFTQRHTLLFTQRHAHFGTCPQWYALTSRTCTNLPMFSRLQSDTKNNTQIRTYAQHLRVHTQHTRHEHTYMCTSMRAHVHNSYTGSRTHKNTRTCSSCSRCPNGTTCGSLRPCLAPWDRGRTQTARLCMKVVCVQHGCV